MERTFYFHGISDEEAENLIKKWEAEMEYISSGARDRNADRVKLEQELRVWCKEMVNKLKTTFHIPYKYTNYAATVLGDFYYIIVIPYVLPSSTEWKSREDFTMSVVDIRNPHSNSHKLGECKTPEEIISLLTKAGINTGI